MRLLRDNDDGVLIPERAASGSRRVRSLVNRHRYAVTGLIAAALLIGVLVTQRDGGDSSAAVSTQRPVGGSEELTGRLVPSQVASSSSGLEKLEVTLTNVSDVHVAHGGYAALLGPDGDAMALLRVLGGPPDTIILDPAHRNEIPLPTVLGGVGAGQSITSSVELPHLEPGHYGITLGFTQSPDGDVGRLDGRLMLDLDVTA